MEVVKAIDPEKIKADYELVAQVGTKRAFEIFIGNYKNGFYVDLAREQLKELTKLAALEPTQTPSARPSNEEQRAWSRVEGSNDPAAIQGFINRYPTSPLALNAKNRLNLLERNTRERDLAAQRADDERRAQASAAAEAERQRVQREADAKRIEDERRLQIAKSERERAELQAKLKREEDERRAKLAEVEKRHAELQAQIQRLEDDRRAKQAEAERQKAAAREKETQQLAALQPAETVRPSKPSSNTPALIKSAQAELNRIGCYSGSTDGAYNDATKIAIRRYLLQKRRPAADIEITDDVVKDRKSVV